MTVYAKTSPIGLDRKIYWIQNLIEDIGWSDIGVYGKVYINQKDGLNVAQAYSGDGEYKEIFIDDRLNAVFGFIPSGTRTGFTVFRNKVRLICSVNLTKIYGASERNDEEAIKAVLDAIYEQVSNKAELVVYTDKDDVFRDLSLDRFKHRNMQPWFNFAIEFNINYKI